MNVESPAPLIWKAPPFPGAVAPVAVLLVNVTLLNSNKSPAFERTSIPPPALTAVFPDIVRPSTFNDPILVKIPPPEPAVPVAELPSILEAPFIINVPISL